MLKKRERRQRGFTLPEVLVTVTLLAILGAIVVPAVVGQISAGETSKLEQNLLSLRAGVEQFTSDVHRYPGKVSHLYRAITNTDKDAGTTPATGTQVAYPSALVLRWKGPYLQKDSVSFFQADNFGAGASIADTLMVRASGATNYLTAVVTWPNGTARSSDLQRVDRDLDNWTVAGDSATGMIRVARGATTRDTLFFLLIPIQ